MEALAGEFGDKATFLLVNLTSDTDDAIAYAKQQKIETGHALHGICASPPAQYGIKYIPHKCVIGKDGVVVKNFDDVDLRGDVTKLTA